MRDSPKKNKKKHCTPQIRSKNASSEIIPRKESLVNKLESYHLKIKVCGKPDVCL